MKKCLHFIVFIFVLFGFYACASAPFGGYPLINGTTYAHVVSYENIAKGRVRYVLDTSRGLVEGYAKNDIYKIGESVKVVAKSGEILSMSQGFSRTKIIKNPPKKRLQITIPQNERLNFWDCGSFYKITEHLP